MVGRGAGDMAKMRSRRECAGVSGGRFCYQACGLAIASDAPIAGLVPAAGNGLADVTIAMEGSTSHGGEDSRYPYRLAYSDDATFLVDATGCRVIARWAATCSDADAANYLTGSVLAFVLRVRGSVPLHASAVAVNGRGVLFVGDSWSGKSSTAAAFSTLGYSLLSDDMVRVDDCGPDLVAYPFQPKVNVWGDSAATLFGVGDGDAYSKRSVDALEAGCRFQAVPVPIASVYVLAERAAGRRRPLVKALTARDGLIALVRHTHGGSMLNGGMRAQELDVLARLVERVPVRELSFGDSLEDLVPSCGKIADALAGPKGPALHI
jgi:hypothetical protein